VPAWEELKTDFDSLAGSLRFHRIDYQWGAAGEYVNLTGGRVTSATRRFEVLAAIAGAKLADYPADLLNPDVLRTEDPRLRWYHALRHHSGAFEHGPFGYQTDDAGNHTGNIFTGSLNQPAEASATLALHFSAIPLSTTTPDGILNRLNRVLHRERENRGALWLTVGFILMLVLAVFAL
jgi:hypothetical protein